MSQNKNITDIINALGLSFIVTIMLIVGRDVIKILNDKIEKLNGEIVQLKAIVDENNDKHRYHLKEIEASFKTKFDDFEVKYNSNMVALNVDIDVRILEASRRQDETTEDKLNVQDETINDMLDTIEDLNGSFNAIQTNINAIIKSANEQNTFVSNELVEIHEKIKELETEMPVCIGVDMQQYQEVFANPKYRNNISNFQHFSFNIECLKKLPLVKHIDMISYQRIIVNGSNKYICDLTTEEKVYIKQICDECRVKVDNAGF